MEGVFDADALKGEREVIAYQPVASPLRHEGEVDNDGKALFVGLAVPDLEEVE
jgi:hypothetical protein